MIKRNYVPKLIRGFLSHRYIVLSLLSLHVAYGFAVQPENFCTAEVLVNVVAKEKSNDTTIAVIDNALHNIIESFFDQDDTTSFHHLISSIIMLLKIKKEVVADQAHVLLYQDLIAVLEKNITIKEFPTWVQIFVNPAVRNALSEKTRDYINSLSYMTMINTLRAKLHR